jgi:hypothetical protein
MLIDTFMKLIEELVKIAEHRRNDRRQLFSEIVEPMYQQLLPVIDEYYALFFEAKAMLEKARTGPALEKAVHAIRDRREATLHARVTIRGLIEEMERGIKDDHVKHFANQVSKFFYSTEVARVRKMSVMHSFVELCDYVQKSDLDKRLLMDYVSEALKHMVENSAAIASTYSAVRLHCLCPPKFLSKKESHQAEEERA